MFGYKLSFQFKSSMLAFLRSQCSSMVLLFIATRKVAKVMGDVDNTLNGYGALVIRDYHTEACFLGLRQESSYSMLKPL